MKSLSKKYFKGFISVFCLALYLAVFVVSPYLHHHASHEKANVVSVSKDTSCDLCKVAPQKVFGYFSSDLYFVKNTVCVSYVEVAENTFSAITVLQLNKAPPVA